MFEIVDALATGRRGDAAAILFEYMSVTQAEIGLPVPQSVAELPGALRPDCEQPERSYGQPGALLLACVAAETVGCIGLRPRPEPGTAEVKRLYVRAAHRRIGIARALMAAVHDRAARAGFIRVVLDVMPTRTEAIAFYRDLGYTDTAPYEDWTFPMVYLERTLS